jgi:hypothetical protein
MKIQTDNPNRLQELEAENAELRRQLAERDERDRQAAADEAIIAQKLLRGLSREQAIGVIKRQRAFDAAKKAARQQNPHNTNL